MTIAKSAPGGKRELLFQLIRYGLNGVVVTSIYTAIFVTLDTATQLPIQACNVIAFLAAVVVGYNLHGRITFRGQGGRGRGAQLRYLAAALPSLGLNAFWTWLFAVALKWPHWTIQVPIWCVTPLLIFAINRWWVFR